MIPLRVTMKGWMRYRDEQVADFNEGRLIAICGENGAGKSSIFDAMTFALYGRHRLGQQNIGELISEGMDQASVDFEFDAEGRRYIIHRSRTRNGAGAGQSLHVRDDDRGEWVPVPGTEKEDGLNAAVLKILRLSADAFTASFMLQQGEATAFLDAAPKQRFEIISSLIGLKEYEALATAAAQGRLAQKGTVDALTAQIGGLTGIDDSALADAQRTLTAATAASADAHSAAQSAQARLAGSRTYAALIREAEDLARRIAEAQTLIVTRPEVQRRAEAHAQLLAAAETAARVRDLLSQAAAARASAATARAQASGIDIGALESAFEAASNELTLRTKAERDAVDARERALAAEKTASDFLALATAVLEARKATTECEERIAEAQRELAAMDRAESEAARLSALADALPALDAWIAARKECEHAAGGDPRASLAAARKASAALNKQAAALADAEAAARKDLDLRQEALAHAAERIRTLDKELEQRKAAGSEATCSRCGQAVDKKHAKAEIDRLTAALAEAKQVRAEADAATKTARAAHAQAQKSLEAHALALQKNGAAIAKAEAQAQALERAELAHTERRAAFVAIAPPDLAAQIPEAATAATLTTARAALAAVPQESKKAHAVAQRLHGVQGRVQELSAQRQTTRERLQTAEARLNGRLGDVHLASQEHAAADAALRAAQAAFDAARKARTAAETAKAGAEQAREAGHALRAQTDTEAQRHDVAAAAAEASAQEAAHSLHDAKDAALADPEAFVRTLAERTAEFADAPRQLAAIQQAELQCAAWEATRARCDADAAAIPPDCHVDPAAAEADVVAASQDVAHADAARDAAMQAVAGMQANIEHAKTLAIQHAAAKTRFERLSLLAKLLGQKGLKGQLVTGALADITAHANAFLQRLTGGTLELTLAPAPRGDTLVLRALDATCMEKPHDPRALSGSQKFRCAVAVASGIGQYAGAGGMRSIVIDEGFASLDEGSQLLMVDELKQLATHMDKVIVVSHLAAFQDEDNFPNRIVVEKAGDASRIRTAS